MIKISELYIHPLKSAASISVSKAEIDTFGLKDDRRWMLVDESGTFLSQRQLPKMCLIKAEVTSLGLRLSAPGRGVIDATVMNDAKYSVVVWGDKCNSLDCGNEVARYLSDFLGKKCRLVYFPDNEKRQVDLEYAKQGDLTGFSDGFPLLLISQASLDDLNTRLDSDVSMTRFRPNIVVAGTEAFAEDEWKEISIGGINLRVVKPCSRCAIPSIDPLTGQRSAEPVKTLRTYRLHDSKVFFGQNLIPNSTGFIEVGMTVDIVK